MSPVPTRDASAAPQSPAPISAALAPLRTWRRGHGSALAAASALLIAVAVSGCATAGHGRGATSANDSEPTIAFNTAQCGGRWHAEPGLRTFGVENQSGAAAEVYLVNPANGAIFGAIDGMGAGTTRPMQVDLGSGSYAFQCVIDDVDPFTGPTVKVPGHVKGEPGILPVTDNDLLEPAKEYHAYVAAGLIQLLAQTSTLAADVKAGNLTAAKSAWLTAHLTYERLGAAYGTFGNFDDEIDGRPDGLVGGVSSPQFTGFYRIEYGLWHGQSATELTRPAAQLLGYVKALKAAFPAMEIDLLDIGLRTHEILENALEFQLSGHDDYGSGTTLATVAANITGTEELLTVLHPLLVTRYPGLPAVYTWLGRLRTLVDAQRRPDGSWIPVSQLSTSAREQIDSATGQVLEDLAPIAAITEPRRA
jgi:iron uptake system component EfeO